MKVLQKKYAALDKKHLDAEKKPARATERKGNKAQLASAEAVEDGALVGVFDLDPRVLVFGRRVGRVYAYEKAGLADKRCHFIANALLSAHPVLVYALHFKFQVVQAVIVMLIENAVFDFCHFCTSFRYVGFASFIHKNTDTGEPVPMSFLCIKGSIPVCGSFMGYLPRSAAGRA
mgnify:CR=1 FL=1